MREVTSKATIIALALPLSFTNTNTHSFEESSVTDRDSDDNTGFHDLAIFPPSRIWRFARTQPVTEVT